ncbi:serine hydrolase domain-containing protein [Saccharomonospora sp. NPDC046836]|uniref:serine hydrolase domain-containing protein n=1 Tax=Saccharomonospora sp. NPDC046836 TaxID=3156921 RepID=UPI0033F17724
MSEKISLSRRSFGKLAGAAGIGALVGSGALTGTSAQAAPAWRTTGTAVSALKSFDDQMKAFMQARGVQAGQLAVTYRGRLVLARGYTYSNDSTLSVQPTSLFRIASLSKSLTASALARLAQDGKLNLGSPVTSFLDLTPPEGQTRDARLANVTLWRLLQHTGGWDRDISGDTPSMSRTIAKALGVPLELRHSDVIRYSSGRPLDFKPGSGYAYGNYGYQLAGRIVEKVSGMSYESYVRQKLLNPLGITRMKLGNSISRHAGEVPYESQYTGVTVLDNSGTIVPTPYGAFSMRLHDSSAGWVASAVDLVRWARAFDKGSAALNDYSLGRVFAKPETGINAEGYYYGLGWYVQPKTTGNGRTTWHTGNLPGTYSLLMRTYEDMSWAALFNQRDDPSGLPYSDIKSAMWDARRGVTSWPSHDLFPQYF